MSYVIAFRTEYDLRATYVENRGHILQIFIHVKFTGLMGVKTDWILFSSPYGINFGLSLKGTAC